MLQRGPLTTGQIAGRVPNVRRTVSETLRKLERSGSVVGAQIPGVSRYGEPSAEREWRLL